MPNCNIDSCRNKYDSHGYCGMHQMRFRRYGDPSYTKWPRHGDNNSAEHRTWRIMKQRCYDPKHQAYNYYGGKGIIVCSRWRNSYINFITDMGRKPTEKHSIERRNGNGNYEPSNCYWATKHEQMANRSNSNKTIGVCKSSTGWEARLTINHKDVLRKWYKTEQQAINARKQAEMLYLQNN